MEKQSTEPTSFDVVSSKKGIQPLHRPKYKQLNANSEDLFGFNLRGQEQTETK